MSFEIKPVTQYKAEHEALLLEADPNLSLIQEYLPHTHLFEAILNTRIVGVIALAFTSEKVIEVKNISVHTTCQNQGIGLSLLSFADEFAKEHRCLWLDIFTGSTSVGQLYLYQKHGFRMQYIDTNYFTRHYPGELREHGIPLKDRVALRKEL